MHLVRDPRARYNSLMRKATTFRVGDIFDQTCHWIEEEVELFKRIVDKDRQDKKQFKTLQNLC